MFSRLKNWALFQLEQTVIRGAGARLAIMVCLILLVALVAGLLALTLAPGFESAADAIWWAFLRLTDPGYLGDDHGVAKATISTAVTVLGYVLFMGALIAILVQWLGETMDRLEQGLTPVALDAHFVLLGWTSRTLTILEEILSPQERVEYFLQQRGVRRLRVALLAERADAGLRQRIASQLGAHWNARQIILRSGSPLRLDGLSRVDFAHASAILIPAADTTANSTLDADTRTVKALMTMGAALDKAPPEEPPLVVAELQEMRHAVTLRELYPGPMEIIAGDQVISRLIVQNVRHPGLSHVYAEFVSDISGSQIYVRKAPALPDVSVRQVARALPDGMLLGIVRPRGDDFQALLNPPGDLRLEANDRVVLAARYTDATPPEAIGAAPELQEQQPPLKRILSQRRVLARRRVLVLGWNHRVPSLLEEFAAYTEEVFTIDIASQVSATKREKRIRAEMPAWENLEIRQLEFDYTVPAYLESVDPASYDNLVLLPSERLKSEAESDARTILGYLVLRDLMEGAEKKPAVLVELTDPDNAALFENRRGEVLVTPLIISRIMARVALRRELRAVFDELFSSAGSEVLFRRIADYELAENPRETKASDTGERVFSFAQLQRLADARGEIAIGIRRTGQDGKPGGGVRINPGRDEQLRLTEDDEIIVLTSNR